MNILSKMTVIERIRKTTTIVIFVLFTVIYLNAQTTEQPILPWEEDFVNKWGLNDDIAWMAEDISEFDMNYNDGFRAGIWGMTASSARFYGLKVNSVIDERFNLKKSTEAVARYMNNLIAFHHGDTLAAITMYINTPLVEEGDSAFKRPKCAIKHIDIDVLAKLDSAYNAKQTIIIIKKPIPVCTTIQEPTKNGAKIQPTIADNIKQVMTVDETSKEIVKPAVVVIEEKEIIHVVKKGDTLTKLANKYGVSISDIKKWNKLKGDIIIIDQKLTIRTSK